MDFLAIIRKADFIDLFKYGKLNVYSAINFDGNIMAHANDDDLFERLTRDMNLFEYSFEYIVIHFISDNRNGHPYPVSIENVRGLYTFDEEAQKEMNVSFDPRIRLHVSPWSEKFKALHNKQLILQSKRGIDNLWRIFGLSETDRKKCESIITNDIISEVFNELFSYKRPIGEQSIWTYLLRYERHSFYPKNTKGYFCDYIHVACNWMEKNEIQKDVAFETALYNLIKESPETNFEPLSQIAKNSNLPSRTDKVAKCEFAVAAPLFLLLKDRFSSGFYIDPKTIKYAKNFKFECSVAVYLLGLTLGYDKTYDAYYDSIKLSIFEEQQQAINETGEQGELFNDGSKNDKRKPMAWLWKKSRNNNTLYKPAFDENEIAHLVDNGYNILKSLTPKAKEEIAKQGYEVPKPKDVREVSEKYRNRK